MDRRGPIGSAIWRRPWRRVPPVTVPASAWWCGLWSQAQRFPLTSLALTATARAKSRHRLSASSRAGRRQRGSRRLCSWWSLCVRVNCVRHTKTLWSEPLQFIAIPAGTCMCSTLRAQTASAQRVRTLTNGASARLPTINDRAPLPAAPVAPPVGSRLRTRQRSRGRVELVDADLLALRRPAWINGRALSQTAVVPVATPVVLEDLIRLLRNALGRS